MDTGVFTELMKQCHFNLNITTTNPFPTVMRESVKVEPENSEITSIERGGVYIIRDGCGCCNNTYFVKEATLGEEGFTGGSFTLRQNFPMSGTSVVKTYTSDTGKFRIRNVIDAIMDFERLARPKRMYLCGVDVNSIEFVRLHKNTDNSYTPLWRYNPCSSIWRTTNTGNNMRFMLDNKYNVMWSTCAIYVNEDPRYLSPEELEAPGYIGNVLILCHRKATRGQFIQREEVEFQQDIRCTSIKIKNFKDDIQYIYTNDKGYLSLKELAECVSHYEKQIRPLIPPQAMLLRELRYLEHYNTSYCYTPKWECQPTIGMLNISRGHYEPDHVSVLDPKCGLTYT